MSNNTRRPPNSSSYSDGRGRSSPRSQPRQAPPTYNYAPTSSATMEAPVIPSDKPFEPQHMWILFGVWTGAAVFMLLFGKALHFLAMWTLAVLMCPLAEKIILREAKNISRTMLRVVTSRMLRFILSCVVGFFIGIGFIISVGNSTSDTDPSAVVLSATPTPTASISATATPKPTEQPTATPDATETPAPTDEPTATPKPTEKPTEKPTATHKPTEEPEEEPTEELVEIPEESEIPEEPERPEEPEEPEGEIVWISKSGSRYHADPNCSDMANPSQISKSEAEARGRKPCQTCYLR